MEFVDKKVNDELNRLIEEGEEDRPNLVKSFMGKSVVESTLKRVETHLDPQRGFFVISTHLTGMSEEEEINRVRELRQYLSSSTPRLGYIPLRGKYTRSDNGEIEYEHSFFVPNPGIKDFKEKALELGKKYNQESVLYCEEGKVYFLYQNGSLEYVGDHLQNVEEINQYWSKLKKGKDRRKFWAFESLYPMNSFGLNAAHNWGELFLPKDKR